MLSFLNFIPGFAKHGTKYIGVITVIASAILGLSPAAIAVLHIPAWVVGAAGGVMTLLRGFDNSGVEPVANQ